MKTIAIPLLQTKNSIDAVGPVEILTKAHVLWRQLGEDRSNYPLFDVQTVAENRKPVTFANGITLHPSATLDSVRPDLIVLPSIGEELDSALKKNLAGTHLWIGNQIGAAFIFARSNSVNVRKEPSYASPNDASVGRSIAAVS